MKASFLNQCIVCLLTYSYLYDKKPFRHSRSLRKVQTSLTFRSLIRIFAKISEETLPKRTKIETITLIIH